MRKEDFFEVLGELDDDIVKGAKEPMKKMINWKTMRVAAIAAVLAIALIVPAAAYAIETIRYNAAVGYLTSLGIDVEDLSDYSRQEVIKACEVYDAYDDVQNDLLENLLPKDGSVSTRPTEPTSVTSEQVLKLMPTMTAQDVIDLLGDTQDVGSGILILSYRVDNDYILYIPFTGLDAQLGVYGEDLLKALQPADMAAINK